MQKIHCTTPTRLGIFIHIFSNQARDTFVQLPSKNLLMYTRGGFILRGRFSLKCKRHSARLSAENLKNKSKKVQPGNFHIKLKDVLKCLMEKFSNFEKSFLLILWMDFFEAFEV